jgi:transposase-like protein
MSAPKHQSSKQGSGHQHPRELRERAVRMVEETIRETGERHGVVTRIAMQLGLGSETLRHWVKQAEINGDQRPGVMTRERPTSPREPNVLRHNPTPSRFVRLRDIEEA